MKNLKELHDIQRKNSGRVKKPKKLGRVKKPKKLKKIIKAAAKAGVCPECGSTLILTNVKRHLFMPKGANAIIQCPNGHNLNYNEQVGCKPTSYGYKDMNLHRLGNGLWTHTQNKKIKKLAFKIGNWCKE